MKPPPRIKELLLHGRPGASATVQGWVRTVRRGKEVAFLELNDGSCLQGLQVVAAPQLLSAAVATGCALRAEGALVESPGGGQQLELQAQTITVVGECAADYPLQKKRHSFEFLRGIAHLRPRTNTIGAVWRVRNAAAAAVHGFFQRRGFVWLHTPVLTALDAEGAGELFEIASSEEFFGRTARLSVSGQLQAEAGALALGNVYTFGPTFRAENSNTSRHLAEFWMIEPEMAFCELEGAAQLAEDFLRHVLGELLANCGDDLAFFEKRIAKGQLALLENCAANNFARITYTEAVEILQRSGRQFEFPVHWGADLQSEHERFLAEEHAKRPVIVSDYPAQNKAFYMYLNDAADSSAAAGRRTVRALDVLAPRVGEILGGSQREHRAEVLARRMAQYGLSAESYGWYLDLRRYGGAPHSGFGVGFERLVQFATGMANIRDVMPFPRTPGNVEF